MERKKKKALLTKRLPSNESRVHAVVFGKPGTGINQPCDRKLTVA
jgi:hypothetical protein